MFLVQTVISADLGRFLHRGTCASVFLVERVWEHFVGWEGSMAVCVCALLFSVLWELGRHTSSLDLTVS